MRVAFALVDLLGKLWNLPNTLLGLLVGGLGHAFGGRVGVAHDAIEFRDNPLMNAFSPCGAITLGNVIVYGSRAYHLAAHEQVHVLQGQFTGPLYLPLAVLGMSLSLLSWPVVRLRRPGCSPFHGRLNFMEGWPSQPCLYACGDAAKANPLAR